MMPLLFLYFLSVSCELFYVRVAFFHVRPSLLVALFPFFLFLLFHRFHLDREFLSLFLGCFCSLLLSSCLGEHFFACFGLLIFFLFNFLMFFVLPTNLFRIYSPKSLYRLYVSSFLCVGLFAMAQVLASLFGVALPGVTQTIGPIARGQAFFYEPSYYALYATPFAVFQTVHYLLTKRHLFLFLTANVLLLFSTSTGCLFSYAALFLFLMIFKALRMVRSFSLFKHVLLFTTIGAVLFGALWTIHPSLIKGGLVKYLLPEFLAASFTPRWEGIKQFWSIFLENPFFGTGLGGTSAYYIKKEHIAIAPFDTDLLHAYSPMNVTTELLASLGLLGIVMFGSFFFVLWRRLKAVLLLPLDAEERTNVIALGASLLVLFFTLQFNQSIMRSYVWLHVGLCVGYLNVLRESH